MKKLLSLLLCFVMVMSIFAVVPTSVSAATYNYLFPVNNGGKIAYVYGYSSAYGSSFHTGIDIHSNGDDNIYAAESGTVIKTANNCGHVNYGKECEHYNDYGNCIKIKHSNGTISIYGHLLQHSLKVKVGDTVTKGQAIAIMGSSGYSTGKHLHFEVRLSDGSTKVNVNPTSNGGSVNYSYSGYGIPTPSFTYTSINTGKYYLKHNATGKYMNVSYGTDANKQNVDLYDGFYTAEVMNIISTSYGYKMRPECCTSRVINAWGDNPSSGANVNIYDDTSDSTQSWKFQAVSGGYIIHNAYNTSLVLDNSNGNICINTYTGGSSQIWSLVPYHTHNYNTYAWYEASHPHYKAYRCSCGEVQRNTSQTTYLSTCNQCVLSNVHMSCSKKALPVGETNTFTFGANNATGYTIGINKNGTRIITETVTSGKSYVFNEAGDYTAYVTCHSNAGGGNVDSNVVSFTVFEPVILGEEFEASIINSVTGIKVVGTGENNVQLETDEWMYEWQCEEWRFELQEDNSYKIINLGNEYCMDVYNWLTADGTNIGLHTDSDNTAQRFYLRATSTGYAIVPQCNTSSALHIADNSHEGGTNIEEWSYSGDAYQSFTIDAGYIFHKEQEFNGNTYEYCSEPMTWNQAYKYCEQIGGHLVTISSKEENDFVYNLAISSNASNSYCWIGATDYASEGNWYWTNSEEFSYTNWGSPQPDNYNGKEHHAFMYLTDDNAGKWNDAPNNSLNNVKITGFVCEYEGEAVDDDSYVPVKTFEYDNKIYEVFDDTVDWQTAKAVCEAKGGHLVTFKDEAENNAVLEAIQSCEKDSYWLGYTDIKTEGNWRGIDTFNKELGYTNWKTGEPGNDFNCEDYAFMRKTSSEWEDLKGFSCGYHSIGFICEYRKPDVCGDNLQWKYDKKTKTLTIYGSGEMYNYNQYSDWKEFNNVFYPPWTEYADEIETVIIEENVTSIGDCAFYLCDNIKNIHIPTTITDIYGNAFGCTYIENVYIKDLVSYCKIDFHVPNRVASSPMDGGKAKFYLNNKLVTNLVVPKEITKLNANAFNGCASIKTITLHENVTSASGYSCDCPNLVSITILNPDCSLGGITRYFAKGFTVYGYSGSTSEKYAKERNLTFVSLENDSTIGDTDGDGKVSIIDATLIQRHLAMLPNAVFNEELADTDKDGRITILDATMIQRYLAGLIESL